MPGLPGGPETKALGPGSSVEARVGGARGTARDVSPVFGAPLRSFPGPRRPVAPGGLGGPRAASAEPGRRPSVACDGPVGPLVEPRTDPLSTSEEEGAGVGRQALWPWVAVTRAPWGRRGAVQRGFSGAPPGGASLSRRSGCVRVFSRAAGAPRAHRGPARGPAFVWAPRRGPRCAPHGLAAAPGPATVGPRRRPRPAPIARARGRAGGRADRPRPGAAAAAAATGETGRGLGRRGVAVVGVEAARPPSPPPRRTSPSAKWGASLRGV